MGKQEFLSSYSSEVNSLKRTNPVASGFIRSMADYQSKVLSYPRYDQFRFIRIFEMWFIVLFVSFLMNIVIGLSQIA